MRNLFWDRFLCRWSILFGKLQGFSPCSLCFQVSLDIYTICLELRISSSDMRVHVFWKNIFISGILLVIILCQHPFISFFWHSYHMDVRVSLLSLSASGQVFSWSLTRHIAFWVIPSVRSPYAWPIYPVGASHYLRVFKKIILLWYNSHDTNATIESVHFNVF